MLGLHLLDVSVRKVTQCNFTEEETCSEAEIGHSALAGTEAVVVLKHRTDSGETYHSVGICDSSIEAQNGNYWGKEQHLQWANPGELERFADVRLVYDSFILVRPRHLLGVQYWTVGFFEDQQGDEEQNAKLFLSEASNDT